MKKHLITVALMTIGVLGLGFATPAHADEVDDLSRYINRDSPVGINLPR